MIQQVVAICAVLSIVAPAGESQHGSTAGVFMNGGVSLSYALTRPTGTSAAPAVVIGHGSGPVKKEQCRALAVEFLARGYATLCFDKRGVGASSGTYEQVTIENSARVFATLASDVAAAVGFAASQPGIDARRIGLVGGSQAGWILPLAAARAMPTPAFMILLSGPTVSVGEEIVFSRAADGTGLPIAGAYARLDAYAGPRGFDPMPMLRTLNVPGLWLLGDADRSIPIRDTTRQLDQLIAGGRPYRRATFSGSDHSLRGADIWPVIDEFLAGLR